MTIRLLLLLGLVFALANVLSIKINFVYMNRPMQCACVASISIYTFAGDYMLKDCEHRIARSWEFHQICNFSLVDELMRFRGEKSQRSGSRGSWQDQNM